MENETKTATETATPESKPAEADEGLAQRFLDLKNNSVSREKYEGLVRDYQKLTQGLLNDNPAPAKAEEPAKKEPTRDELVGRITAPNSSNLDIVESMLVLRSQIMKSGGVDPFLPQGLQVTATENDIARAQAVADVFQDCVDKAEGDSGVFTALLSQRTRDIITPSKKGK